MGVLASQYALSSDSSSRDETENAILSILLGVLIAFYCTASAPSVLPPLKLRGSLLDERLQPFPHIVRLHR